MPSSIGLNYTPDIWRMSSSVFNASETLLIMSFRPPGARHGRAAGSGLRGDSGVDGRAGVGSEGLRVADVGWGRGVWAGSSAGARVVWAGVRNKKNSQ